MIGWRVLNMSDWWLGLVRKGWNALQGSQSLLYKGKIIARHVYTLWLESYNRVPKKIAVVGTRKINFRVPHHVISLARRVQTNCFPHFSLFLLPQDTDHCRSSHAAHSFDHKSSPLAHQGNSLCTWGTPSLRGT